MEYVRTDEAQIYADFARRLGTVLRQYLSAEFKPTYEATLSICLLQSLLTNCTEHIRAMASGERRRSFFTRTVEEEPLWGLSKTQVLENTFPHGLTFERYTGHLRDALSHPTRAKITAPVPSTGFTSTGAEGETIRRYLFVSSPDVRKGRPRSFSSQREVQYYMRKCELPDDVEVIPDGQRFSLRRENQPYFRVFRAGLSVRQIEELVIGLSNHLAQPLDANWDQVTVQELVRA